MQAGAIVERGTHREFLARGYEWRDGDHG